MREYIFKVVFLWSLFVNYAVCANFGCLNLGGGPCVLSMSNDCGEDGEFFGACVFAEWMTNRFACYAYMNSLSRGKITSGKENPYSTKDNKCIDSTAEARCKNIDISYFIISSFFSKNKLAEDKFKPRILYGVGVVVGNTMYKTSIIEDKILSGFLIDDYYLWSISPSMNFGAMIPLGRFFSNFNAIVGATVLGRGKLLIEDSKVKHEYNIELCNICYYLRTGIRFGYFLGEGASFGVNAGFIYRHTQEEIKGSHYSSAGTTKIALPARVNDPISSNCELSMSLFAESYLI